MSNRLLEQWQMLVPRYQHRGERFAKVGLVGYADRFHRGNRIDHLGRPHRQAGSPQHAHEIQYVLR